jgi:VWFA-related protein
LIRILTLFLLAAIPCLSAVGWQAVAPGEYKSFAASPGDTIIVQNDYGRIRIEPTTGSSVEIRSEKRSGAKSANPPAVMADKRGDKVFVYCFYSDSPGQSVDIGIRAPKAINIIVWGANPGIEARGLEGSVRLQSLTGDTIAEDLSGSVSVISESGNIVYRSGAQPHGDVRLETTSGDVTCELGEFLNGRGWFRAGGTVSLGKESQSGQVEQQFGTGGPLIYAGSLKGNVRVEIKSRQERTVQVPATSAPPAGDSKPVSAPPPAVPEQAPRNRPQATDAGRAQTPPNTDAPAQTAKSDTPPIVGSDGSPTFKVSVDWVFLNVSVRDRYSNRSLTDLTAEDFGVYEDGVLQEVGLFETAESPFHLLLLLDVSGSTESFIGLSKEASIQFTGEINANDRIGAATFNSNVRLIQDFTNDRREVAASIRRVRSGGGTAFYDALLECVDNYMRGIQGRKAIVVFTDGVDNQLSGSRGEGSRTPFRELFRRIQEIDTIIYPIFLDTEEGSSTGVPSTGTVGDILADIILGGRIPSRLPGPSTNPQSDRAAYREARAQLQEIADQTGGRMYAPQAINDLNRVYSEIADDLRIQYWLGYTSSNRNMDGSWRAIQVKVKNRSNAVVRTRKGYYARSQQGITGQRAVAKP